MHTGQHGCSAMVGAPFSQQGHDLPVRKLPMWHPSFGLKKYLVKTSGFEYLEKSQKNGVPEFDAALVDVSILERKCCFATCGPVTVMPQKIFLDPMASWTAGKHSFTELNCSQYVDYSPTPAWIHHTPKPYGTEIGRQRQVSTPATQTRFTKKHS